MDEKPTIRIRWPLRYGRTLPGYVHVERTDGQYAVFGPADNPRTVAVCERQEDAKRIALALSRGE